MLKQLLSLFALFALVATPSLAASLTVAGAGDLSHPFDNGTGIYTPKWGIPGAAVLWETTGRSTGLEFGASYLTRSWDDILQSGVKAHVAQASLIGKYHLARYLSLGAGAYYSKTIGNLTDSSGDIFSPGDYGIKDHDYGVVGAVDIRFPLGGGTAIFLGGRYDYGLASSYRDIIAMAGLRFWLGR